MTNMFSISLVTLDSYQSTPIPELDVTFSEFRGTEIKYVPVVRIFGSTPSGTKTCLHIHGVFPYIYIPCIINNNVDSFMYKLAAAIDSGINVSLGSAVSNTQHVYKIQRISGIPLYGYHEKEHLFFKIYFYNPAMIKRAADLLQNGTILNQSFQPHEAHIPFILQFMIDYNLYGMSLINLKHVKFRHSMHTESKESESFLSLSDSQKYLPVSVMRQSTCTLEVDAQSTEILNREDLQNGFDLNPGIAAIWNEEKCRRDAKGLQNAESQMLYSNSDNRMYDLTDNDIYQEEKLLQRLQFISETTDSVTSITPKSLSYPLEVENEHNLFNASDILNHFKPLISNKQNKEETVLNNEFFKFEQSVVEESQDKNTESSILDSEDMHLVNILANLAEANEEEKIVDNDSMLGSQFSNLNDEIKENEDDDDEIDNLNITSLDLNSLSSWNSVTEPPNQLNVEEQTGEQQQECSSSLEIPQYDGLSDHSLKVEKQFSRKTVNKNHSYKDTLMLTYFKLWQKQTRESKKKRTKTMQTFKQGLSFYGNTLNKYKLDHQDLDVYDIDEIELSLTGVKDEVCSRETGFNRINHNEPHFMTNSSAGKLKIPALDGNVDSSGDSDIDPDVTIERQEKRICVYKSNTKSKNETNVPRSLKKRKLEFQDLDSDVSHKRRNVNLVSLQNESPSTPKKTKMSQSAYSLSKKYSPLNVKIISPRHNRSIRKNDNILNQPSTSKSTYNSPIQKQTTERHITHGESGKISRVCLLDKFNDSTHINKGVVDSETNHCSDMLKTKPLTRVTPKSNREVRKKLDFTNEKEVDCTKNDIEECYAKNSSSTEAVANVLHENGDPLNISEINPIETYTVQDGKVSNECIEPDIIKQSINTYEDDIQDKTVHINENNEDEEDFCNMTYTQYLNSKLEIELNTPTLLSLESTSDATKKSLVTITTKFNPPSKERIINSMKMYGLAKVKSDTLFFSNKVDLIKQKEHSNKITDIVPFKCCLDNVTGIRIWRRVKINEFYPSGANIKSCDIKRVLAGYNSLIIQPLIRPPTPKNVKTWLQAKKYLLRQDNKNKEMKNKTNDTTENVVNKSSVDDEKKSSQNSNNSQHLSGLNINVNSSLRKMLENPLLYKNNDSQQYLGISFGQIDYSMKGHSGNVEDENLQHARGLTMHQCLTILSVEVHVNTQGKLLPNPEHNAIEAIFYAVYADVPSSQVDRIDHGAILVNSSIQNEKVKNIHTTSNMCAISYVSNEENLLNSLIKLIRYCDPDILIGWEIESASWGYIFQRAAHIGFNSFMWQISRISNVTSASKGQMLDKDTLSDIKVPGRIVLDVWRIMRHEIALLNYTFENVMYNVMRERVPCPSFQTLSHWWKHNSITIQWRVITHYVIRVVGTIRILIHLDIIGKTCEHARLIGIQFYEIFSRGSQFRVESMMLRLAKPLNYIAVSPSIQQKANMRAPQALPLIMEPQSIFYTDPLIVLDFQSLYPSIIIAYNYCFSTCLGRVEHIGLNEPFEFGATTLRIKKSTVTKLQGKINFSPCGVAFVKPEVRLGILPRMLTEILNTRLMVKASMKLHGNENQALQRVLHSQQLGLKLIANVTYGYTAANFSGRMPCIEIGDSVVSKGRETLERAIKIVESTPKWGAQVVYGDTDSLFILLPGRSREDAFDIGAEIADTVTAANPPPVKLKFEKVLQPSILQTKKRYCGYMYEYLEQDKPEYLAKGIETVRRDGCPAVAKILEKSLKILFDTKDISLVKLYVTRQFDKILRQKISIQDLTFAKEFRGLRGYKTSACVPALELTRRLMRKDPRAIPRTGERVRYVIVAGAPNQPLIQCVRTPMEVILDEGLSPNSIYYITKVIIPPLNRCFNLFGIDVNAWYREMSHRQTPDKAVSLFTDNQKLTIKQFFGTIVCAVCGDQTQKDICTNCIEKPYQAVTILHEKIRWLERTYHELNTICQSCVGCTDEPECESLDCPVLYRLAQSRRDLVKVPYLNQIVCNIDTIYTERRNI
ncbi:DNA polymerase zeta catalytic subunit isoform X2 [Megachile rotundata]|uniref:DNA polymerase zeta catalytic subunit isoform X2 n=1 Tax=Megachile rotundata TaxID=143995 RepID=UPI00061533F4|nr:PREDICTED: DNA polymerase zeta catalytic subunit isoform X2 [Megachile rotundata]